MGDCLHPEVDPAYHPPAGTFRQAVRRRGCRTTAEAGSIALFHRVAKPVRFLGSVDWFYFDRRQCARNCRIAGAPCPLLWISAAAVRGTVCILLRAAWRQLLLPCGPTGSRQRRLAVATADCFDDSYHHYCLCGFDGF